MMKLSAYLIDTGDTIFLGSTAREVLGVYKGKDSVRIEYQGKKGPQTLSTHFSDKVRIQ